MQPSDAESMLASVQFSADAGDDECAHIAEDELWLAVLVAISNGSECAAELAKIALRSTEIHFSRWYA